MSNVTDITRGLEIKLQKHLDLAEVYLEQGDRLAYDDHMKLAESIFERLSNYEVHKIS